MKNNRLEVINNILKPHLDSCTTCNKQGIFIYRDVNGPLCPVCDKHIINEYKHKQEVDHE